MILKRWTVLHRKVLYLGYNISEKERRKEGSLPRDLADVRQRVGVSQEEMGREQWMRDILRRRREEGTFRELRTPEKDLCFVDFTSNDYLGLGRAADLRQAVEAEARRAREETAERRRRQRPVWKETDANTTTNSNAVRNSSGSVDETAGGFPIVGSGGSRLLSGNSWYAEELEDWIARFHNRPAALLFNSGYDANLGLMSCLPQPGDVVVCDELVHNSVRMGCRMGRQEETVSFRHNDVRHLDDTLTAIRAKRAGSARAAPTPSPTPSVRAAAGEATAAAAAAPFNVFVAVESVYSMDGDLAPLTEILRVAGAHGALVIVDEAHATGVFGEEGRGLVSSLGLEAHPALLAGMHSFGKALGAHGAVVVGSATLKHFLVNYARPLIYSTSLPLDSLACIRCSYLMQAGAEDRRRRVLGLADKFQSFLQRVDTNRHQTSGGGTAESGGGDAPPLHPNDVPRHRSPIQSVLVPGNERSLFVAESLRALGFDVRAIRKPTVAEGTERLRITLHAYNTDLEVETLARHIRRLAANGKGLIATASDGAEAASEEGHTRSRSGATEGWMPPGTSPTRARL